MPARQEAASDQGSSSNRPPEECLKNVPKMYTHFKLLGFELMTVTDI